MSRPDDGDHRQALVADEVQRLARGVIQLERRQLPALEHLAHVVQCRHEVAHRLDGVGLEVGAADDAFLGLQVDQDDRPVREGGDARHHWPLQFENDRPRAQAANCQGRGFHAWILRMPPASLSRRTERRQIGRPCANRAGPARQHHGHNQSRPRLPPPRRAPARRAGGRGAVRPLQPRALFHRCLALPDRAGRRGRAEDRRTTCARRWRSRARRACRCCRAAAPPRSPARRSGRALVIDFSKHLNRLVEVDAAARTCIVEPGIVLDELNRQLKPHGPVVSGRCLHLEPRHHRRHDRQQLLRHALDPLRHHARQRAGHRRHPGRRQRGALRRGGAQPLTARATPLPLGGGWREAGWGEPQRRGSTPTPNPSPQGGGEPSAQAERATLALCSATCSRSAGARRSTSPTPSPMCRAASAAI